MPPELSKPNKNTTTTTGTTSTVAANHSAEHPQLHVKNDAAAVAARARAYALSTDNRHYQTPPVRPVPQPQTKVKPFPLSTTNPMSSPPSARRKISPLPEDDDYTRFVQSLGMEDPILMASPLLLGDDEEDFELTDLDESDDEDVDDSHLQPSPLEDYPFEHDFYTELEAELGSLLEEDLEAAVSTLLAGTNKKNSPGTPSTPDHKISTEASTPTTPLRDAARTSFTVVTPHQVQQLQQLLRGHYQLLLQNSVLAVRAARKRYEEDSSEKFYGGETPEDLTEILDGAISMLQDLDQVCSSRSSMLVHCECWQALAKMRSLGSIVRVAVARDGKNASSSDQICSVLTFSIVMLLTHYDSRTTLYLYLSVHHNRIARMPFVITFKRDRNCRLVSRDRPFKLYKRVLPPSRSLKCLAWHVSIRPFPPLMDEEELIYWSQTR